jgi:LPS export ABC transporter protein LptC
MVAIEQVYNVMDMYRTNGDERLRGMRARRGGAAGCCFAVLLCCVALWAGCGDGDQGARSLGTRDIPDQEFTEFTTYESDSGVVKWVLQAPVARIYNARRLLMTVNPTIVFFDDHGETTSVLTADKGEFQQVSHDLTALGNVVVTSRQGYTLETESLVWVNELEEIHTEDFVRFVKENDVLTGFGFRSDPELKNVVIQRNVEAYLRDDEGVVEDEVRREGDGREDRDD